MRSVEQQLQAAIAQASPLSPLELSLRESRDCVLAADVTALYPIPSFNAAAHDGYAVVAQAVAGASAGSPVTLTVVDSVAQGFASDASVTSETTVWVAAGALLPAGADAVIPASAVIVEQALPAQIATIGDEAEDADADADESADSAPQRVSVTAPAGLNHGVVREGSQRAAGATLLTAGTRLGDRALLAVAAGGHPRVSVHPEPRVVVVTVGDELVDTTRALTAGLVHDAVSVLLVAAGEQAGAATFRGGPSRRDPHILGNTIQDQLVRADLVIVVGEDDRTSDPQAGLVATALRDAGCTDLEYCRVDPGPVIGLGTVGEDGIGVITVGRTALAAFVGFEIVARPTIAALAGRESLFRPVVRARLTETVDGGSGARRFVPGLVKLDANGQRALVTPLHEPPEQAELWLHRANALIIVPEDATSLGQDAEVAVIRLDRE